MTDRRPVRNRKSVNYSGIDDCSDDDFADSTPPPPLKKQKSTKAPEKSKQKDHISDDSDEKLPTKKAECGKKKRTALSDKIYERELKKALHLSLSSSGHSQEVAIVHSDSDSVRKISEFKTEINDAKLQDEPTDLPKCTKSKSEIDSPHTDSSLVENKRLEVAQTKLIGTVMDESIEVLEDSREPAQRKTSNTTRTTRRKKTLSYDDESEESSDESEESSDESEESYSDEDYDDKSDVDFDEKKKPTISKSKPQLSKTKPARVENIETNQSPKAKKLSVASHNSMSKGTLNKTTSSSSAVRPLCKTSSRPELSPPPESAGKKSSTKSSSSTQAIKVTKAMPSLSSGWKPPAMSSSGNSNILPTVMSPTTGLRLGLSRNQHIKPLHKSFKVT